MNYKSLLCAATLLAASGIAQAFPTYEFSPTNSEPITSLTTASTLKLVFAWDFEWDYSLTVVNPTAAVFMNNETGNEVKSDNIYMEGSSLFMHFDSEKIAEYGDGVWTLAIPAGTFTVSTTEDTAASEILVNEPNPAITTDYTLNISGSAPEETPVVYPQIEFLGADPADGAKLISWGDGSEDDMMTVKLYTSDDASVNSITWKLYDATNGDEYVRQGEDNRYDWNRYGGSMDDQWANGLFIAVGGETPLVEGHTYRVDLTFYALGNDPAIMDGVNPQEKAKSVICNASVSYEGLTKAEEYSSVTYLSVSPDPENYVIDSPEFAVFDIQFSGLVKPEQFNYNAGVGLQLPAGEFEPYEGTEVVDGYAARWTFKFSESLVESATGTISAYVTAKDQDGSYVKGNSDIDFGDYYYNMVWECNCGAPDLICISPTPYTDVESLSSITISNDKEGRTLVMALSYTAKSGAEIRDRDGGIIRELGEPEFNEAQTTATWTFEPITENGAYVLMIPEHYFAIGEEFEGSVSNAESFLFYVNNGSTESAEVVYDYVPASVTPGEWDEMDVLERVDVVYGRDDILAIMEDYDALLYKETVNLETYQMERELVATAKVEEYPDWTGCFYTFEPAITTAGSYVLVIPEGAYGDEEYYGTVWDEVKKGIASKKIELHYTIYGQNIQPENPEPASFDVKAVSITPSNMAYMQEISTVTVEFSDVVYPFQTMGDNIASGDDVVTTLAMATLYKITGNGYESLESVAPTDNVNSNYKNPTIYDFNFSPVSETGMYRVVIPQGILGDDAYLGSNGETGVANEEIVIEYVVGPAVGIESIMDGADTINVYDANGVQILKDANVEAAKDLKSGLYIINGKKVMIRR